MNVNNLMFYLNILGNIMNSNNILYSSGNNDECYTPAYGVKPIIKYIPKYKSKKFTLNSCNFDGSENYDIGQTYDIERIYENSVLVYVPDKRDCGVIPIDKGSIGFDKTIVWCPFDKKDSQFVIQLQNDGYDVIHSHIDDGKDFFTYEPENWDIIVSNPPFANKRKIFERALSFGKPFALIMTNTWLNDAAPKQLFKERELQLLMFEERMRFTNPDGRENNKITFSSSYYCYNLLPKQIITESLFADKRLDNSVTNLS